MTLLYIFLGVIALLLWKIYRQREDEKQQILDEKHEAEWEAKKQKEFKEYPHLIGRIDYTWLELFGKLYVQKEISHLNAAFLIYLKEANNTEMDLEVDQLFSCLWDLSEELLEHLEKYHEGMPYEFEIALITYWQLAAEKANDFSGKDRSALKNMFKLSPFSEIEDIVSWFPTKHTHPKNELSFRDSKGNFPRTSEGSKEVRGRITV